MEHTKSEYSKRIDQQSDTWTEEDEKALRTVIGDDLQKNPEKPHAALLDIMDEIIYSQGLRRAIAMDLGIPIGETWVRKQLIYDVLLITHATPEEVKEIQKILKSDKKIIEREDDVALHFDNWLKEKYPALKPKERSLILDNCIDWLEEDQERWGVDPTHFQVCLMKCIYGDNDYPVNSNIPEKILNKIRPL